MQIKELEEEFASHRNDRGWVNDHGGWTHNDALFHAFYVSLLDRLGLLKGEEKEKQIALYKTLNHPDHPGITMRNADNSGGVESHDNTKARIWISHILGTDYIKNFLHHGRTHVSTEIDWQTAKERNEVLKTVLAFVALMLISMFSGKKGIPFVFNNIRPGKFNLASWLGRFQALILQAEVANGEKPNLARVLWVSFTFWLAARSKNSVESRTLMYFVAKIVYGAHKITDSALDYWAKKTEEYYPELMSDVFLKYGWEDHPYRKWYKDVLDYKR